MKYKSLDDLGVLDEAVFNDKYQTVAEVIMEAKLNGIPLFLGVEQGSGKNQHNTYVYFKPKMAVEAKA